MLRDSAAVLGATKSHQDRQCMCGGEGGSPCAHVSLIKLRYISEATYYLKLLRRKLM